MSYKY